MQSAQPYSVYWLSNLETPLANKFYSKYSFRGKARRHEVCAVVRSEQKVVVACAYIRGYNVFKLLAGVAVAPAHQGRGVARLMLTHLAERFDHHTYTFPYLHLLPLYVSLGFKPCDAEGQPSSVTQLYQRYRDQGRDIAMMVYTG
ncbi:MAG: GNAT family N-acetyltransferase [Spongiibacteraceae bacterium]